MCIDAFDAFIFEKLIKVVFEQYYFQSILKVTGTLIKYKIHFSLLYINIKKIFKGEYFLHFFSLCYFMRHSGKNTNKIF